MWAYLRVRRVQSFSIGMLASARFKFCSVSSTDPRCHQACLLSAGCQSPNPSLQLPSRENLCCVLADSPPGPAQALSRSVFTDPWCSPLVGENSEVLWSPQTNGTRSSLSDASWALQRTKEWPETSFDLESCCRSPVWHNRLFNLPAFGFLIKQKQTKYQNTINKPGGSFQCAVKMND